MDLFASGEPSVRPMVVSFVAFVFTAAFALALMGFVVMHLRLAATNHTTIEAYEKQAVHPWLYDRGTKGNFLEVFGRQPRLWAVPFIPVSERQALLDGCLTQELIPLRYDAEGGRYEVDQRDSDVVALVGGRYACSDMHGSSPDESHMA